jgi:hypothetical protein
VEGGWNVFFGKEIQPQRVAPLPPPLLKFTEVLAFNPIFGERSPERGAGLGHAGILPHCKKSEEIKKEPNGVESPTPENIRRDVPTKEHPHYLTNGSI